MGKHYSQEVKLEAIRMYFEEGMTQDAITQVLGIRDRYRVKKWVKAYRREGLEAFSKMEHTLLKKYHTELRKQVLAKRNIGLSRTKDKHTKLKPSVSSLGFRELPITSGSSG